MVRLDSGPLLAFIAEATADVLSTSLVTVDDAVMQFLVAPPCAADSANFCCREYVSFTSDLPVRDGTYLLIPSLEILLVRTVALPCDCALLCALENVSVNHACLPVLNFGCYNYFLKI